MDFNITNDGGLPVEISHIYLENNLSEFTFTQNCPTYLYPSDQCTASVTFTPSAEYTNYNDVLAIYTADRSTRYITLNGYSENFVCTDETKIKFETKITQSEYDSFTGMLPVTLPDKSFWLEYQSCHSYNNSYGSMSFDASTNILTYKEYDMSGVQIDEENFTYNSATKEFVNSEMKVKFVETIPASEVNSTIFSSDATAYHIVSTNLVDKYDFYHDSTDYYYNPITTFNQLISYNCESGYFMSKNDDWYGHVGIAFGSCDENQTSGTLIEVDYMAYPNYILNADAGSWEIVNVNGEDTLVVYPDDVVSYAYNPIFRVIDGAVMRGELEFAGTGWNSYDFDLKGLIEFNNHFGISASNYTYDYECEESGFIWTGSSCVEPSFYADVDNPKTVIPLVSGYNYVTLRSDKTLCNISLQSHTFCDQNNTLESLFGLNSHIEKVYKHKGAWSYWSATADSTTILNRFIAVDPQEALLVKTDAATQIELPYSSTPVSVGFSKLQSGKWYLLRAESDTTMSNLASEVNSQSGLNVKYVMRYKNNAWGVYAPLASDDAQIDSIISRINSLSAYDSYWLILEESTNITAVD
jgi:hypothetical protein